MNKYGKVMLLIAAILILLMSGWLFLSDHLARQAIDAECAALVPNSLTTQRDYDNYCKKCLGIKSVYILCNRNDYNRFKQLECMQSDMQILLHGRKQGCAGVEQPQKDTWD